MKKYCLAIALVALLALVGCAEHEHSWDSGVVTKPATCTEKGEMAYTCLVCEVTRTEEIDATGHKWDDGAVTTNPSCTDAGVKTFTCTVCKETKTDRIPATGHAYAWTVVKNPDCVNDGSEEEVCSKCDAKGNTRVVAALGHVFGSDGKCTREGCNAKETSAARIGTNYFDSLTDAIKSLKDAESKTAEIHVLKESVTLENFKDITGSTSNSSYHLTFIGESSEKNSIVVATGFGNPPTEGNHQNYIEEANLSFKDITVIIGDNSNYQGFVRAGSLEFEGCAIVGRGTHWGDGDVIFKKCEFKDNGDYSLWLYTGKNYVFEDCKFTSSVGKFLHPYNEKGGLKLTIKIKNCSFENTSVDSKDAKPVLNIKPSVACDVSFEGSIELKNVAKGKQGSEYFQLESDNGSIIKINGVQIYPEV